MERFQNSAIIIEPKDRDGKPTKLRYGYNSPSPYLYLWSRLLQSTISQAGTFMLTGKFHTRHCAIYKCEGGCVIDGYGDLVLHSEYCSWDYHGDQKHLDKLNALITYIVLCWDPNNPIDSMLEAASKFVSCTKDKLHKAIDSSNNGGPFGGNAINYFFDHNPFNTFKVDENYERFCLVNYNDMTDKEVDQMFADRKLGEALLEKMIKKCREAAGNGYVSLPLCCSPRRGEKGLGFWINTGRSTQIDGWKSEKEINDFLKSDGKLIDKMRD